MSELKIQCPKCSHEIELTEQLAGPMLADLQASFKDELAKNEAQANKTLAAAQAQAKEAARAETAAEQAALEERLKVQDEKLREAQAAQTTALKREQQLKDKEAEMELTLQKMLAEERPALAEKLTQEADAKAALKMAEQTQVMEGMKRQIEALKQKSDQGSMQTQGEAAEIVLEETLAAAFPIDGFSPVPKGVSGADVRQDVTGQNGISGSILWESKRTKNWTAGWLSKLRDDQRSSGCEVAVITSHALPEGVDSFWHCRWHLGLCATLRRAAGDVIETGVDRLGQCQGSRHGARD